MGTGGEIVKTFDNRGFPHLVFRLSS